ncbi:Protein IMPACT-like protein [Cladobotryum mycophilum]|uniref:Protein IMPACT-like protein n=1 Tax=Cladobotryum mycophilum TaxID=491253 RepID=A0ABR0SMQ4_9HYPO
MSEELRDEVEAINSIYGEDSLTPADGDEPLTYILKLPGDASSLRVQFPEGYPAEPPAVLGTHHSSGGKRGAGARDLGLFREVVGGVYEPGLVCLFDAVEEFTRRREEEEEAGVEEMQQHDVSAEEGEESTAAERDRAVEERDFASMTPPPWTLSEVVVENKSTFIARVARISSTAEAKLYLQHLLWSDKRIRTATHNITAWRVRQPDNNNNGGGGGGGAVTFQDCDDDGETAAGGRLLHLMQVMEVWDAVVVVTRWYGGVKLGPRRFALINGVARDGFVRAGLVVDNGKEKKRR